MDAFKNTKSSFVFWKKIYPSLWGLERESEGGGHKGAYDEMKFVLWAGKNVSLVKYVSRKLLPSILLGENHFFFPPKKLFCFEIGSQKNDSTLRINV